MQTQTQPQKARSKFFAVLATAGLVAIGAGVVTTLVMSHHPRAVAAAAAVSSSTETSAAAARPEANARLALAAVAAANAAPAAAPPPPPTPPAAASADEAREQFIGQLASTGLSTKPWTTAAKKSFDDTLAAVAKQDIPGVTWGETRCYAGGCMKDAFYDDLGAFQRVDQTIVENHEIALHEWRGLKHRTGPVVRADGHVVATWALMSPES